jgi:TatD DNase family protein
MIDTHCHLDACDEPVDVVVARAREAGVERILAIGMNDESCRHALEAAEQHDEVYVAIGRHPHESAGFNDLSLRELAVLLDHPKVRAIGETGLDYHREHAPEPDQRIAFETQVELAAQMHLPLVVHTRDAAADTFAILERTAAAQGVPVVLHCFSLVEHIDECIEFGYYCSFAGNVTYPNATELHEAAQRIPNELLLVETDAPFLSPQPQRGKKNEPAFVKSTAAFLAELRGQTYEQLEAVVQSNAEWVFRW